MTELSFPFVFVLLASVFALSLALTRLMIALGPKLGLMDEPGEDRRVHLTPIPRAGGIAIWVTFVLAVGFCKLFYADILDGSQYRQFLAFTASSALLITIGFIDDSRDMRASVKLLGQIAAALLYFILDPSLREIALFGYQLPTIVSGLFFVGWCVLLINAFNLIDGLDGLCSGLVVVSLFVIAGLELAHGRGNEAVIILIMLAAVAGFLRFNLNPARIFLGDAGSMMLGFFLATSATQIGGEKAVIGAIMLPIAIAGVPLLDVLLAIWRRSARNHLSKKQGKEKEGGVFSADKDHLHHRFLALGMSQRKVAFFLQGLAILIAILCFAPVLLGGRGLVITLCGFIILGLFGLRHFARVELLHTGSLMHLALKKRSARGAKRALLYFYDVLALSAAAGAAMVIETNLGVLDDRGVWSLKYPLIFVTCGVVVLQTLRIYRRVWSRASIREFFIIATGLTLSGVITSSIFSATSADVSWSDFRCGFIASQLAVWLILVPRALPEALREFTVDTRHRKLSKETTGRKQVLVYGAGTVGNLFVEFMKSSSPEEFDQFQIAGFLDDNVKVGRRSLQGFRILGGLGMLEELRDCYPIHGVVITINEISDFELHRILEETKRLGMVAYRWEADRMPQRLSEGGLRPVHPHTATGS